MENRLQTIIEVLWSAEPLIALQQALGPGWSGFLGVLTLLGNTQGIVLLVAVAIWFGARRVAYYLLGATLVALALAAILWQIIHVPRPDHPRLLKLGPELPTPSYPSGHAAMITALWGPLAAKGRLLAGAALGMIASVSLSRLYLAQHYPGDVLAGLLVGLMALIAIGDLWPGITRWATDWPWWAFMLLGAVVAGAAIAYLLLGPGHQAEEAGLVAAAGVGLPLEHRYIRLAPLPCAKRQRPRMLAIGLVVPVLLLAVEMATNQTWPLLSFGLALLAGLWALLAAPLLFVRLGLAASDSGLEPNRVTARGSAR